MELSTNMELSMESSTNIELSIGLSINQVWNQVRI